MDATTELALVISKDLRRIEYTLTALILALPADLRGLWAKEFVAICKRNGVDPDTMEKIQ